jgi:hypothetical protein
MHARTSPAEPSTSRIAVDIGSTVVKVARIGEGDRLLSQDHYARDFEAGIAGQVESLLDALAVGERDEVRMCSSANGGLRVGIVCLTKHFSGAALRNQVLLAGANPVFVHDLDEAGGHAGLVDILLVGGGIDCEDAGPLELRLRRFDAKAYRFGALLYAGNRCLADAFAERFPEAVVVANPLADTLSSRSNSVFEVLRRAYLDDLIYKEGVSELGSHLSQGIRPTPEVVSRGFQRALLKRSSLEVVGACILIDVGGATTDFHYTVEIVREDSDNRPAEGASVARYVFTDLGIVASRDSTLLQLRGDPRLYEFLACVLKDDVRDAYRLLREGEYDCSPELLAYACLFLGLDRFAHGRGPGLPTADLGKVAQIILTGGAAQPMSEEVVARMVRLLLPDASGNPMIVVDRHYQVWVDGITWDGPSIL